MHTVHTVHTYPDPDARVRKVVKIEEIPSDKFTDLLHAIPEYAKQKPQDVMELL